MTAPVRVAVPQKGRPLEAVLDCLAARAGATSVADDVASTLRYEKAVAKGDQRPDEGVYERLAEYSDPARDHSLELGERLFPSETVLMENQCEVGSDTVSRSSARSRVTRRRRFRRGDQRRRGWTLRAGTRTRAGRSRPAR